MICRLLYSAHHLTGSIAILLDRVNIDARLEVQISRQLISQSFTAVNLRISADRNVETASEAFRAWVQGHEVLSEHRSTRLWANRLTSSSRHTTNILRLLDQCLHVQVSITSSLSQGVDHIFIE